MIAASPNFVQDKGDGLLAEPDDLLVRGMRTDFIDGRAEERVIQPDIDKRRELVPNCRGVAIDDGRSELEKRPGNIRRVELRVLMCDARIAAPAVKDILSMLPDDLCPLAITDVSIAVRII